jgi:hypothetical protein
MEEFLKLKSIDASIKFEIKTSKPQPGQSTNAKYYVFGSYSNTFSYVLKNIEPDTLTIMRNELAPLLGITLSDEQLACIYYICTGTSCTLEQIIVSLRIKQFTLTSLPLKTIISSIMDSLPEPINYDLANKASNALKIKYMHKSKKLMYTTKKPQKPKVKTPIKTVKLSSTSIPTNITASVIELYTHLPEVEVPEEDIDWSNI